MNILVGIRDFFARITVIEVVVMACAVWFASQFVDLDGSEALATPVPEESARLAAAKKQQIIRDPAKFAALVKALSSDPSPDVRAESALALGWMGDRRASGLLARKAGPSQPVKVRHASLSALAILADPETAEALIQVWRVNRHRDDAVLHYDAQGALVAIGADAVPALLKATSDKQWRVRWLAVNTLARVGDMSLIPKLTPLRKDANALVRSAVEDAIEKLKKQSA